MRILLDTHIALWAVADSGKLSEEVIQMLEAEKNEIYYSVASVWEIAIKHHIKPEQMPIPEEEFVILQTARIYSNAIRKASGWQSVVGSYCKFKRCAV